MRLPILTILTATTLASSQPLLPLPLDIPKLLSSLAPAPPTDPRFTTFHPPGPSDVRSPCPGLNALANHAFLPPSGRNLTLPQLLTGLAAGLNIAPDFTTVIGAAGLLSSPNPLRGSFDLNDLSQHNFPIEHDASISRVEAALGNPTPFNAGKWAQYLSAFDGRAESDIPTVARAKSVRYADSVKTNPDFVYGVREAVLSYGENALWVQSLGDGGVSSGKARMDYAKVLFEEERLPYQEGWRVARVPVSLASLGGMVVGLFAESPTVGGEGVRVVGDSYKDVLMGIVGGSEVLANLTGGISSVLGL